MVDKTEIIEMLTQCYRELVYIDENICEIDFDFDKLREVIGKCIVDAKWEIKDDLLILRNHSQVELAPLPE